MTLNMPNDPIFLKLNHKAVPELDECFLCNELLWLLNI